MQGIFVIQFKYRSRDRRIVILIPRDSLNIYLHIDISYNTFSQSENTVICLAMLNNLQSRAVTINRFESDRIDSSSQPINRFKTPESIH